MLTDKLVMAAAGAAGEGVLVEDVFSTFLYEGTGQGRTITNGIDLAGEGGMVWLKDRTAIEDYYIFDTERGANKSVSSNLASVEETANTDRLTGFNSDGFDLGNSNKINRNGDNFVSWIFRKQPGFFDVVTYTGDGVAGRTVAHNLGSAPGMIWVKRLGSATDWAVYHRSEGATKYGYLNTTAAFGTSTGFWNDTEPTATEFTLGNTGVVNNSGSTYVAYLFAHDDAQFGPNADESIIKCGTYTGNGSNTGPVIDLGWEPQWLMIKITNSTGGWFMVDTARGIVYDNVDSYLAANTSSTESYIQMLNVLPTGFQLKTTSAQINGNGSTFIYMAIRRPDAAPAAGSDFFQLRARAGTGATLTSSIDFNADMLLLKAYDSNFQDWNLYARGLVDTGYLKTNTTDALGSQSTRLQIRGDVDSTVVFGTHNSVNGSSNNYIDYIWKRARGAFDTVQYEGTGSLQTVSHGLGAVPQMIWVKAVSRTGSWAVYSAPTGNTDYLRINSLNGANTTSGYWNNTDPASTEFTVNTDSNVNDSSQTYLAMLFGNVPGVIDIGSYTGTGVAGLQIDCGFTAGARFVLIKNTSRSGSWLVFDTARGITSTTSPQLKLSIQDGEHAEDLVDPYASGFTVDSTTDAINASGDNYLYMAIA